MCNTFESTVLLGSEVRLVPPWPRGSHVRPYERSSDAVPRMAVLFSPGRSTRISIRCTAGRFLATLHASFMIRANRLASNLQTPPAPTAYGTVYPACGVRVHPELLVPGGHPLGSLHHYYGELCGCVWSGNAAGPGPAATSPNISGRVLPDHLRHPEHCAGPGTAAPPMFPELPRLCCTPPARVRAVSAREWGAAFSLRSVALAARALMVLWERTRERLRERRLLTRMLAVIAQLPRSDAARAKGRWVPRIAPALVRTLLRSSGMHRPSRYRLRPHVMEPRTPLGGTRDQRGGVARFPLGSSRP